MNKLCKELYENKVVDEGLKDEFGMVDPNLVNEIRQKYYGVSDNFYGLIEALEKAMKTFKSKVPLNRSPLVAELKAAQKAFMEFRKMDTGRIL